MSLTVEDALALEVFSRVPRTVFAGHASLGRHVRWVHPVEIPDIARFLNGGEMLLTAGLGIGQSDEAQRRHVREVAAAGASVLVLELSGRAYSEMPPALVAEARELGFPLVGLVGELPFVEVSAQVHARLVDDRVRELTAYERLNRHFMELLLAGGDHMSFTQALADEVSGPVILEDSTRRVVAYSSGDDASDAAVGEWDRHSRLTHRDAPSGSPTDGASLERGCVGATEGKRCTRRAIVIRGERWGWLHVVHGPGALRREDEHALDRTADAIAISVLSARELGARVARRENALINRLLLGDISGEAFINRALRLGKDLRRKPLLAVWTARTSTAVAAETAQTLLAASCAAARVEALTADVGDHAMAVVGLPGRSAEQRLVARLGQDGLQAGVSRISDPAGLTTAVRQARSAASVAGSGPAATGAVRFDDLGVLRLLVALAEGPELANYVEDELGPVLQHDATSPHPLLPTLRAFLECDANKSRTAERLYVQRRTLYYRLQRLDRLLRRPIDDPGVRQNLSFALRGLDLLHGGDAQGGKPLR